MNMEDIVDYYNWAMDHGSDPRTSSWLLMSSPWPTLLSVVLYLFIVKKGPSWMEKRPAFNLKPLLVVYNCGLVLLSIYMFWELFASSVLKPNFSLVCQPVDYSEKPSAIRLASVCWWYFFSKIIEFMDTFFFILRKKNSQISFLHIYHHATMVILWWIGVRFVPGGESYFSAMLNCFVHIWMYGYYMLAAFGPQMQKYLWWKKYLTSLQLVQFVMINIHTSVAWYKDCGYPNAYNVALIIYCFSHIVLFSNFYHNTYVKKQPKSSAVQNGKVEANGKIHANGKIQANGHSYLKQE